MEMLTDFLAWAWARHHNVLSWYIRPMFILPFIYFAQAERKACWSPSLRWHTCLPHLNG
jgi:hypothetical protein